MEATSTPPLDLAVVGRAILSRMDSEARQAIVAAVDAEIRDEVLERCLDEVRAEQAGELQHRLDRLKEEKARILEECIDEIDRQGELHTERVRRELREEYRDRLADARDDLKAATERATRAESALLGLVWALLPEGKKIYMARHMVLKELALQELNDILAGLQYRIVARHTGGKRVVACRMGNGQGAARNVFELRPVGPVGVETEPDDAAEVSVLPEDQTPA